ncbi:MAG: HesA/MoeB/ThiF family protein [Deltaproteobacteria bacterium]|nr:HesA/MoeB/ThiF family protein [Deltaproteobacteria bacterium]
MIELRNSAHIVTHGQAVYWVIDDEPLLLWASSKGVHPRESQIHALLEGIVPHRYLRNFSALNMAEQLSLCRSRVLVCGCGGLGGVVANLLARGGIGFIRLVDGDVFVPSNLNRQWFSDVAHLGWPKASAARDGMLRINPLVEIEAVDEPLDASNARSLLQGMDLCVDALDNLETRFLLDTWCRREGIALVHGAVSGWLGQATTFLPNRALGMESIFGKRRTRDALEESLGVPGPTVSLIGSLQAMEVMRLLAGKSPCYEGRLLYFDGESGQMSLIPLA